MEKLWDLPSPLGKNGGKTHGIWVNDFTLFSLYYSKRQKLHCLNTPLLWWAYFIC